MKRFFKLFIPILVLILLAGCIHFRVHSNYRPAADDIRLAEINNKIFALHTSGVVYYFELVSVTNDSLAGILLYPTIRHDILVKKPQGGQYSASDKYILAEVHLYLHNSNGINLEERSEFRIPLSQISKVDTYSKDTGKDATALALTIAAIPVAALGIIMLAWLIDPPDFSSCPYAYFMNSSGNFEFLGEIFGGAIYGPLERHDFMLLPDAIKETGSYIIRINNELSEIQYVNLAEIMAVQHNPGVKVLPDRTGRLHTITDLMLPCKAESLGGNDLLSCLNKVDGDSFIFNEYPEVTSDSSAFNSVIMAFGIPPDADTGKLVIRAGNQIWGDYQINEFTKLFGKKYDNWIRKQRNTDGSTALKWQHGQKLFMDVSVRTDTGWRYIDYFELTGPMGRRDLVMAIPLKDAGLTGQKDLQVKLTTGFMFWEMDYAGMDFSGNAPVSIQYIHPLSAITESGSEVATNLSDDDHNYYIQHHTGEAATITYQIPEVTPGMATTLILHSKGYYEHVRDYEGPPEVARLLLLTEPGRFSRMSSDNFRAFSKSEANMFTQPLNEKP